MTTTTPKIATVTVVSIWSKHHKHSIPPRYTLTLPEQPTVEETLSAVFAATNQDDRPYAQSVCSTSVGDLLLLDGHYWMVDPVGFRSLTVEQACIVMSLLDSRDASAGYDWLVEHKLIPPAPPVTYPTTQTE